MFLKVDHSSGVPIYRQVMEQIKYSMAKGVLKPGDRLPAIRQLSLELKVNPNTIAKAYSELEHGQVIETRRGMGTYVSEKKIEMSEEGKMEIITQLAERLAVEAVQLDISEEELQKIVRKAMGRFNQAGKGAAS
jgi:GntR family transcriptional regulator